MESAQGVDERLSGTFAPAIILPAQYFSALRHPTSLDGERKLRLAVLEDGIECYLRNMNAKSRLRRILFFQVRDWMKADYGDGRSPLTCCARSSAWTVPVCATPSKGVALRLREGP